MPDTPNPIPAACRSNLLDLDGTPAAPAPVVRPRMLDRLPDDLLMQVEAEFDALVERGTRAEYAGLLVAATIQRILLNVGWPPVAARRAAALTVAACGKRALVMGEETFLRPIM